MSGKKFITACKWICRGWAFCSCTLLVGQVSAPRMPGGKVAGRPVNEALRHKLNPKNGMPTGAGHELRTLMNQAYGKLPLSFEPNQGQTNSQVRFLSRGQGYTLFLTGSEAVLALKKSSVVRTQESEERLTVDSRQLTVEDRRTKHIGHGIPDSILRMQLLNANPGAKATGLDEMQSKANYFIGKDPKNWRTNVPNYAKVKYEGVYPGVDLVYYGNQQHLEYDFVLAPGADPSAIQLALNGGGQAGSRQKAEGGGDKSEIRNQKQNQESIQMAI